MSKLLFDAFAGLVFYKYLAVLGMIVLLTEFAFIGSKGRRLASGSVMGAARIALIDLHEWWTQMAMWTMIGLVALIEILARFLSQPHAANPMLRSTNMICGVSALLVFLAARYLFNGEKSPRLHRWLVAMFATLFFIAAATGIPMLYLLPLRTNM